MGSRPRFRSPCVTAPAHLLPYAPLYPLLPVLTHGAASYPPGLAALCRVPAVPRGLRLARSPLAIASRRPRSSPNPGYRLPARSAAPPSPPLIPLCLSTGWTRCSPSSLSPPLSFCRMGCRPLLLSASCPPPIPLPLPTGWARRPLSFPSPLSFCRMGWRPRSRGACGQMLSPVRSGAPPTGARQRGGGSAPRRPGERRVPPHSAELRSLRDQPLAPAQATRRHIASCPHPLAPAAWGWS